MITATATAVLPGTSSDVLLDARCVTKSFWGRGSLFRKGAENRALDDVTLCLHKGEILGLVGESGCGKSTFAKVMLGLERADAGSLAVAGETIFAPGAPIVPAARRGIQMVFQDPYGSLNPRMKVRDLVGEGLRIAGSHTQSQIKEMVREHLELVGLGADAMAKYPHQFSGGQRQRLCIARAIIVSPKLLIADEAASALDVSVQMQILNLLLELRDRIGLGIVFISHDMGVIEYLCDRIAVMYRGRIVEENAAGRLLDEPRHPYTRHLIAARPRVGRPRAGAAVPTGEDDPNALAEPYVPGTRCAYAERCPRAVDACQSSAPVLSATGTARLACFNAMGPQ